MKNHFKELETAIFHINDKGTTEDKLKLLKNLQHKLELQESIINMCYRFKDTKINYKLRNLDEAK